MILSDLEIKERVLKPKAKEELEKAVSDYKLLQVHLNNVGTKDHITQITNLENSDQLKLRQDFLISNKATYSKILSFKRKIFNTKGTVFNIDISEGTKDNLMSELKNIRSGLSLFGWLNDTWLHNVDDDPNGLQFIEVTDEGKLKPTTKSVTCIHDWGKDGQYLDYVIFKKGKYKLTEGHEVDLFRVVDDEKDVLYYKDGDKVQEIEGERLENPFGFVPGIINSSRPHPVHNINRAYVDESIELAESALRGASAFEIYKMLHAYPLAWAYEEKCSHPNCNDGYIYLGDQESSMVAVTDDDRAYQPCPSCNGEGIKVTRDVSDMKIIPIPESGEVSLAPPMGYVTAPTEAFNLLRDEDERIRKMMEFAVIGTNTVTDEAQQTATARYIDTAPLYDLVTTVAKNAERVINFMVKCYGKVLFPNTFEGSNIILGKRYQLENADQLWEKYTGSLDSGSYVAKTEQYIEWLEAKYDNDHEELEKKIVLFKLEPYPHDTLDQIKAFEPPKKELYRKLYFSDWLMDNMDQQFTKDNYQKLKNSFDEYINLKLKENEQTEQITGREVQPGGGGSEGLSESEN